MSKDEFCIAFETQKRIKKNVLVSHIQTQINVSSCHDTELFFLLLLFVFF